MENTDKWTCLELAGLLEAHGVESAVLCPGTRNVPLIMAFNRSSIECRSVIDERSAAFVAMGLSVVSNRPVAVVCTSGTALLNFAPAVAEAFYRGIPLIVISADRPAAWIGQNDGQTICQPGILSSIVLKSCTMEDNPVDEERRWMINRQINDGMLTALGNRRGPIHFNIEIGEPVASCTEYLKACPRVIAGDDSVNEISTTAVREISRSLSGRKVMIVVGFHVPDSKLNKALCRLAKLPDVVVLAEPLSNLHGEDIIMHVDETLFTAVSLRETTELRPDVVIVAGGSLVSRPLKEQLRKWHSECWYVGLSESLIDCFQSLERVIPVDEMMFFRKFASAMQIRVGADSEFSRRWHELYDTVMACNRKFKCGWSDLSAIRYIVGALHNGINLQVSNGMTLRYLLSAPSFEVHRIDCNRGVSGIDGSVSTAVGAALGYEGVTVLLTGDMSAQYDVAALSLGFIPRNFKMIVIANGDGGIFRVIKATRAVDELDKFIASKVNFPARQLAEAYSMDYYEATSIKELTEVFPRFMERNQHPAMLVVKTDSTESASVALEFYKQFKNIR